jgi:hypothetical protein
LAFKGTVSQDFPPLVSAAVSSAVSPFVIYIIVQ